MTIEAWAALITLIAFLIGLLWKLFQKHKEIMTGIDVAREGVELGKNANLLVNEVKDQLQELLKEFKPNGGSTLKDSVVRIENKLLELAKEAAYNKIANKNIINSSDKSGYWISNKKGETLEVGIGLCRLLKRSEEELDVLKWANYIHPSDRVRVMRQLEYIVKQGGTFNEDYRISIPQEGNKKEYINVNAFAQPVKIEGNIEGYYGIMTKLN